MFSLVAHRQGKRVIQWRKFLLTALMLTASSTIAAAGLYFFLAERWDSRALLVGAGAGFVASVLTLIVSLFTPLQRLPIIK
jgi:uncharacterized membrane protein